MNISILTILITELKNLEVSEIILGWISVFLVDRRQAVRVGGTLSKGNTLRGGIPQGTKLGVVLFAVMSNSLLVDWHLRTKFVDDTSAVEILPRNSISLLNMAVTSIYNFAVTHNMKLNPGKCKEMVINFMKNPNFLFGPIVVGSTIMIQRVKSYKLLGVFIDDDLKWSTHVVIRPILEYAVLVWQSICEMQSEKLESIQKRALRVIFPTAETYKDALNLAGLETLASRRTLLCEKYMNKMRCTNHPLNML